MNIKKENISVIQSSDTAGKLSKKRSIWHIDREMLPYKIHFFLFVGAMGATLPYMTALAITKYGLTASNLAAALTTQQFLCMFIKPLIGYLTDYFNKLKATIVGLTLIQAVFYFIMIIIPSDEMPAFQKIESNSSLTEQFNCRFCQKYSEFALSSPNRNLGEEDLEQVLTCFDYSGFKHTAIHCPEKIVTASHSINVTFDTIQTTCNISFDERSIFATNKTFLSSSHEKNILYITLYSNYSQKSNIICISPTEIVISPKDHCHAISNFESAKIQKLGNESSSNISNCNNNSRHDILLYKKDAVALSAANFKTYQYWVLFLCILIANSCTSSMFTMSDTACWESVHGVDYGRQRAWGAISWGLTAPLAGFLNDYTDAYMAAWGLMAVLCSFQIWNLSRMNLVKPNFSQNILKDVKNVFSSMDFLLFTSGVFMNGIFTGIIWFYLTWFLVSIGGNKLIVGLANTFQCYAGELPFMFVSDWLIKKFGHFNIVSLALISHGIRFFLYSYLHNPWWILPIESLHGFTFASFYTAMTSYAKLSAKPGTEATTQSVLCCTYEGLGAGIGCLISGACFDLYGGHTTFFYASFICALATVINVIFTVFLQRRKRGLNVTEKEMCTTARY